MPKIPRYQRYLPRYLVRAHLWASPPCQDVGCFICRPSSGPMKVMKKVVMKKKAAMKKMIMKKKAAMNFSLLKEEEVNKKK